MLLLAQDLWCVEDPDPQRWTWVCRLGKPSWRSFHRGWRIDSSHIIVIVYGVLHTIVLYRMLVEVEISDPVVISRQLLISYRHFSLERHELLCTYIYIRAVMSNFLELTYPWMSTQLVPYFDCDGPGLDFCPRGLVCVLVLVSIFLCHQWASILS